MPQLRQPFQVRQAGIGHLGEGKVQIVQASDSPEMDHITIAERLRHPNLNNREGTWVVKKGLQPIWLAVRVILPDGYTSTQTPNLGFHPANRYCRLTALPCPLDLNAKPGKSDGHNQYKQQ